MPKGNRLTPLEAENRFHVAWGEVISGRHKSVTAALKAAAFYFNTSPGALRRQFVEERRVLPALPPHTPRVVFSEIDETRAGTATQLTEAEVMAPPEPTAPKPTVDPNAEVMKQLRLAEAELARTKSHLKTALARADAAEEVRESIFRLRSISDEPVHWPPPQVFTGGHKTVLTPIIFGSDFQVGEVVRLEQMDGMNEYNMDIFAERYQLLVDRTIDLAKDHVGDADFDRAIYARGGDAINNRIHEELAETNDLSAVPAIQWLCRHEREGIKRWADYFGRLHVVSIPGNHGRTTIKPRSNSYVGTNFETLLTLWLQGEFRDDPRITWQTPHSGDAYFEVQGWKFLLAHGDRMGSRGGAGFIGASATIARGHQKLFQNWAATGRPVDYIMTGHLHTSVKLPFGYGSFGNGSLVGYNAFARDHQMTPDAAKQWELFVHAKRGVTAMYEVQLSKHPIRMATPPNPELFR
jgi:hypothetical protein